MCVSSNHCIQGKTKGSGYNTLKYTIKVPKINKIVYLCAVCCIKRKTISYLWKFWDLDKVWNLPLVLMKVWVFWGMTPSWLVNSYLHFGESYYHHLQVVSGLRTSFCLIKEIRYYGVICQQQLWVLEKYLYRRGFHMIHKPLLTSRYWPYFFSVIV